jgi:hypothetical protein
LVLSQLRMANDRWRIDKLLMIGHYRCVRCLTSWLRKLLSSHAVASGKAWLDLASRVWQNPRSAPRKSGLDAAVGPIGDTAAATRPRQFPALPIGTVRVGRRYRSKCTRTQCNSQILRQRYFTVYSFLIVCLHCVLPLRVPPQRAASKSIV